jgi:hypothetical protein
MKGFLRRLRGVIGTAITWALGWGGVYAVIQVGLKLIFGHPMSVLLLAFMGSILGLIAGGSFAIILSIAERHRTLDQLSLKRVALWGGIGGAALVLVAVPQLLGGGIPLDQVVRSYLLPLSVTTLLGAGSAPATVAIARRGGITLIDGEDEPPPALEGD